MQYRASKFIKIWIDIKEKLPLYINYFMMLASDEHHSYYSTCQCNQWKRKIISSIIKQLPYQYFTIIKY